MPNKLRNTVSITDLRAELIGVGKVGDEDNDSPIEQVRLTVPPTDDPTLPALTFRILSTNPCTPPLGKLMAAYLPSKPVRVPFTNWFFSLNPGPFNIKEHVLITIFASSGAGGVYAVFIVDIVKAFYHRQLSPVAAFFLSQSSQVYLGSGFHVNGIMTLAN
nr:oligopeptide transporter 5 [Quercus suber]